MRLPKNKLDDLDVIMVSKTIFAGIKYSRGLDAPFIVLAGEYKEIAGCVNEYKEKIYEDPPVARTLYINYEHGVAVRVNPEVYKRVYKALDTVLLRKKRQRIES